MNFTTTLLLITVMGIVTYITRRALLRVPSKYFSDRLKNGLLFIPIGIFAALIFPSLFVKQGNLVLQPLYLVAAVLTIILMRISKNVFLSFSLSLLLVIVIKLI